MHFKLDDSTDPGWAKVEILKELKPILQPIYKVRIVEITQKSTLRKCRIGQTLSVAKTHLYESIPSKK
jgi:hypothetical protein